MRTLGESESKLVEIKAKIEDLKRVRKRLRNLGARYVGTFRQIDTYFKVPKGRLKLREIKGRDRTELIYYEREDIPGPKRTEVFIIKIQKPETFKMLFEKVLEKKVVIDKTREIYRYKGTQIHLDKVTGLGTFIEFERKTKGFPDAIEKNRQLLELLMKKLGVEEKNLLKGSYSDLAPPIT